MPSKQPKSPFGRAVGKPETEEGRIKGETYSKTKFYMGSSDGVKSGQRLRMNKDKNGGTVRVPTFVWALVSKWVDDPRTPYRSAADAIRDSLVHRLQDLEDIAQDHPAEWEGMRIQAEMGRRIAEAANHKDAIAGIKEALASAWADGDSTLFYSLLDDADRLVKELPHPYNNILRAHVEEQQSIRRLNTDPNAG